VTDATQTGKLVAAFLRSALAAIASGRPDATVGDVLRDLRFVEAHVQAAVPTGECPHMTAQQCPSDFPQR